MLNAKASSLRVGIGQSPKRPVVTASLRSTDLGTGGCTAQTAPFWDGSTRAPDPAQLARHGPGQATEFRGRSLILCS